MLSNIFSFIFSLPVQQLFWFGVVLLVYLCFCYPDFWCHSKKPIGGTNANAKELFSMISFRSSMTLNLMVKPLCYFSWFVCVVWNRGLISFFCMWLFGFPSSIYSSDCPHFMCILNFHHRIAYIYLSLFLSSLFCSIVPMPYCFDYHSFTGNQEMWSIQLCSSCSRLLWHSEVLYGSI